MKAKIRTTGEVIDVTRNDWGAYVDENCVCYNLKDLVFEHEEDEHWQEVRERAAIAAMQGLLANPKRCFIHYSDGIKKAINYADELVKELKKK